MFSWWLSGAGAAAIAVAAAFSSSAAAQDFAPLPERVEIKEIEGQAVELPIRPEFRLIPTNDMMTLELRVRIGLGDLQDKAVGILQAMIGRQSGGDLTWSFPTLSRPVVADAKLEISGSVRVEADILFNPHETADFVLALTPRHSETDISVEGTLETFDLGESLLGDIGIEGFLKDLVTAELSEALGGEDAVFTIPEELLAFRLKFTSISLVDAGSGSGELVAEASTQLTGAEATQAIAQIAALQAQTGD